MYHAINKLLNIIVLAIGLFAQSGFSMQGLDEQEQQEPPPYSPSAHYSPQGSQYSLVPSGFSQRTIYVHSRQPETGPAVRAWSVFSVVFLAVATVLGHW